MTVAKHKRVNTALDIPSQLLTRRPSCVTMRDMENNTAQDWSEMTSTAYDALLDEALEMLGEGNSQEEIVIFLSSEYGWSEATIEVVVTDAAGRM